MRQSVWIGFDPREADAFAVAKWSAERRTVLPLPIRGIVLDDVRQRGLYHRPTSRDEKGRLIDDLSRRGNYDGAMSTEFAISRFLTPHLAGSGWALFLDADMLVRADLGELFALADPEKAVMVVKHDHRPLTTTKMDGQKQTAYHRKNWSSVMLFNCDHPANRRLTLDMVNSVPGRELHQFGWLEGWEIGELPRGWNHLVGEYPPNPQAKIAHFTLGVPSMDGYADSEFADEWREELRRWASGTS